MRKGWAAGLAGLVLVLSGCGATAGHVVGKEYEPATSYSCQVGSVPVGQASVPIWGTCTDGPCFRLDLEAGEETGSVCTSEEEFNAIDAGEWYPTAAR